MVQDWVKFGMSKIPIGGERSGSGSPRDRGRGNTIDGDDTSSAKVAGRQRQERRREKRWEWLGRRLLSPAFRSDIHDQVVHSISMTR